MAREKIGGQTADTTELPPEYRALEEAKYQSIQFLENIPIKRWKLYIYGWARKEVKGDRRLC
jgi:hypothetical protein